MRPGPAGRHVVFGTANCECVAGICIRARGRIACQKPECRRPDRNQTSGVFRSSEPNRSSWSLRIRGRGDFEDFPTIPVSPGASPVRPTGLGARVGLKGSYSRYA